MFQNYPQTVMTQRRIMLASMMDEEDGKAVDSDGSMDGEEELKKAEVERDDVKFKNPKLFS